MAVAQTQCPNCHQAVPVNAKACPHCGVYLQLPGQAHSDALLGVAQTPQAYVSASDILPQTATSQSLPDALKQIDAAAGTHLTISGVLIAFYASAIFAGKVAAPPLNAIVYVSPVFLLLITIICSVRVFYPGGYIADDYSKMFRIKDARLRYSSLLLEISVGVLAVAVLVYLLRPGA